MIIDVSAYLGFWPYWKLKATTPETLIETARSAGIDRLVVASNRGIFYDCAEGNQVTAEAVRRHSGKLIGLATLSPLHREPDEVRADVRNLADQSEFRGLKLFPVYHGYRLKSQIAEPLLEEAARLRLPVLVPLRLSMNWGYKDFFGRPASQTVDELLDVADHFPDLNLLVGCVNYLELTELVAGAKKLQNIFVETSGLQSGFEALVESLGAERVLLGTGMPVQYPSAGLTKVLEAGIGRYAKELILHRNAAKLLNLQSI